MSHFNQPLSTPERVPLPPSPIIIDSSPRTFQPRSSPSSSSPVQRPTTPPPQSEFQRRYPPSAFQTPSPIRIHHSPRTPSSLRTGRTLNYGFRATKEEEGQEEELVELQDIIQPNASPFHDRNSWTPQVGYDSPSRGRRTNDFARRELFRQEKDEINEIDEIARGQEEEPTEEIRAEVEPERSSGGSSGYKPGWDFEDDMELDLNKKKEFADALGMEAPPMTVQDFIRKDKQHVEGTEQSIKQQEQGGRNVKRPAYIPPRATTALLFSQLSKRDILLYVIPAFLLAATSSIVPPAMTYIIGESFGLLTEYPIDLALATSTMKSTLLVGISRWCLYLTILGVGGLVLNILMIKAWIGLAERITDRLRRKVYRSVMGRGMEWFDLGMGLKDGGEVKMGDDAVGAGGLMAKFTKETDDVMMGSGRYLGESIQSLCTSILCIALAFWKSWNLSLVILSAIPLIVFVQIITEKFGNPLYEEEKRGVAQIGTNLERCTAAISTVKAFNAQTLEEERFAKGVKSIQIQYDKQIGVWGLSLSGTNLVVLLMFVGGFWYGAKLVNEGKSTAVNVMTVFWACLLGSTTFQGLIPRLVYVTRAKVSMSGLVALVEGPSPEPRRTEGMYISGPLPKTSATTSPTTPLSPVFGNLDMIPVGNQPMRPLRFSFKAKGEINIQNVSFSYPSRPDMLVLNDVSLFLPSGEMTFIVGGSGSGKSTIAQLLLRLYEPLAGVITMDDQDMRYMDAVYTREHVRAVQQGCVLFDMSVHDNVSMGLAGLTTTRPENASQEQVIDACSMAMLHDFISSLPDGYETRLGTKGSTLSGGQKQRLAIARAKLRDPALLILDECTSALDATSRLLVFDNIKKWRKNKSTIVITHDLSQIQPDDFVYLMKDGRVTEQGFREDLLAKDNSVFGQMATQQAFEPLPADERPHWAAGEQAEEILEHIGDQASAAKAKLSRMRPVSMFFGGMASEKEDLDYIDILADYSRRASISDSPASNRLVRNVSYRMSQRSPSPAGGSPYTPQRPRLLGGSPSFSDSPASVRLSGFAARRLTWNLQPEGHAYQNLANALTAKRLSYLQPGPQLATPPASPARWSKLLADVDAKFQEREGSASLQRWSATPKISDMEVLDIKVNEEAASEGPRVVSSPSLFHLWARYLPGVPNKHLLVIGIILAVGHGIAIPMWAKYIAILMSGIGGTQDVSSNNKTSLIVVIISIADAICLGGQYWFLFATSSGWLAKLRRETFAVVLKQEQAWFDQRENSPTRLVQLLVKDGDDMRPLVAVIMGRAIMVFSMIVFGFTWSLVIGWRLALVGAATAPIFAACVIGQTKLLNVLEARNKVIREALAKTLYESVANIRAIRAMALEGVFGEMYDKQAREALKAGQRGAWGTGLGLGVSLSLIYLVQALMIYVMTLFMIQGTLNYQQALQVYTLILFSLSNASSMLDFVPNISKARMAAADFESLHLLSSTNQETKGDSRFPIEGNLRFEDVRFQYPTRKDVEILKGMSFEVRSGECIAIVGASGSGKSTVAALLQRLYEPTSGRIILEGTHDLETVDVKWLREHVAVVSQQANLFDATVAENIAYGSPNTPLERIEAAAKEANVHEFILSLPQGYSTNLGENASLISGGQAQRIQIARALIRRCSILILDECTSALDTDNQRAVLNTILKLKESRTTIFITHKADVMRRCDRVLCLDDGRIVEDGEYGELVRRRGVFAKLMNAGEWE